MTSRKSVVFKVTMDVYAKTTEAKDDLRAFVWDFGQVSGGLLEIRKTKQRRLD
jgi:hypothetical protein